MFGIKLTWFGAVAILATLGTENLVCGQPQNSPLVAGTATSAAPQFRPLTAADVQDALAQVKTAADALEQRFATGGASTADWKEYLSWEALKSELKNDNPKRAVLGEAYKNLAAGYEGLELKWFANLRIALRDYLLVSESVDNPALEALFKSQVEELAQQVKSLSAHPTTDETWKISSRLLWLETFRQAPELVRDVRGRFSAPNFHAQISADAISAGGGGPVDDVSPIDDCILGTAIHGTGHTVGQTTSALIPDPNLATFNAMVNAVNYSNNVGHNGPVCIYTTGQTCLSASKRFWIDEAGLHAYSAQAAADAHTTINDIASIKGRKLVEQIAWRKACQQKGQAEGIASMHAASKFSRRVDEQADPRIQKANERYEAKVHTPFSERRVFPNALSFDTLATALEIHGTQALKSQLAASSVPPALTRPADLSLSVHESTINNMAENVLTGMRLTDDMLDQVSLALQGKPRNRGKDDVTTLFPPESPQVVNGVEPMTVSFHDDRVTITLIGAKFIVNGQQQPDNWNVRARYTFDQTDEGLKAVRKGDGDRGLQIYKYGTRPNRKRAVLPGPLSVLQYKFNTVFAPEIKLSAFSFNGENGASGAQFVPQEIIAQNGWLVIGYRRAK